MNMRLLKESVNEWGEPIEEAGKSLYFHCAEEDVIDDILRHGYQGIDPEESLGIVPDYIDTVKELQGKHGVDGEVIWLSNGKPLSDYGDFCVTFTVPKNAEFLTDMHDPLNKGVDFSVYWYPGSPIPAKYFKKTKVKAA
jgi:hypothetical protein